MKKIIVVGAGHAGVEAALISAKFNSQVYLFTLKKNNIAFMPCNPSIGGPAKGIVVREIDALGGIMAKAADATKLQIKILNKSRGPAVWSIRSQNDKIKYSKYIQKVINDNKNISIIEEEVCGLIIENKKVIGVNTKNNKYFANAVILTTGTYLKSCTLKGSEKKNEGPNNFPRSNYLSDNIKSLNFKMIRLKTGTPPRVFTDSINFKNLQEELGHEGNINFSFEEILKNSCFPIKKQEKCYLIYTNPDIHEIIKKNLIFSPIYGQTQLSTSKIGPRYCPSIEDKIVKFSHKNRHQIFLEPESLSLPTTYIQGLSTSLPEETQLSILKKLPGFENCKVSKYGYAIEYDAIISNQLYSSLETKKIKNLYFAGQLNGTSGYEEAAAQGLMAGINANLKIRNKKPLILKRDEAYIGVLINDLVTSEVLEPYRLLTSRAEYRLLLRNDNAEDRLYKYSHKLKLIPEKNYLNWQKQKEKIKNIILKSKKIFINHLDNNIKNILSKYNLSIKKSISLYRLLSWPQIKISYISNFFTILKNLSPIEESKLEIKIKFQGYINKQKREISKINTVKKIIIPENIEYEKITNLSLEAKEKFKKFKPYSIREALNISGINYNDIQNLLIFLKKNKTV